MLVVVSISSLLVVLALYLYISKRVLQQQLSIFERTFKNANSAIVVIDDKTDVVYSNDMVETLFGSYSKMMSSEKLFLLENNQSISMKHLIENHKNHQTKDNSNTNIFSDVNARLLTSSDRVPVEIFFNSFRLKKSTYTSIMMYDKSKELTPTELNRQDFLLDIPNQNQAIFDINEMILLNRKFALVLISIDDFYKLKGSLGQITTDLFIKKIVEHLKSFLVGVEGVLYSASSDTFLIKIPDIDVDEDIEGLANKIKNDIKAIMDAQSIPMDISFSIGANFFPFYGNGSTMLLDNTYKALLKAKEQGKCMIYIDKNIPTDYTKSDEFKLYNEMKVAIDEKQFELYYQPLFDIKTGVIIEAEALVRWNHPTRGFISPIEFIPIAKKTGLIIKLGEFVITQIIKQQKKWEIYNFPPIKVSINITLREIETGDLVSFIKSELYKNQIHPEFIKLEITENIAMTNAGIARREFMSLKKLGVSLGLDNFGKGQSSFGYLKTLPINSIQIDRMFVTDLVTNIEHQKIVKAIVALGHNFDLKVLVGGIEDKQTYDLLKSYGCDIVQGYYFSRPLAVTDFQHLLREEINISSMIDISSKFHRDKIQDIEIEDAFNLYSKTEGSQDLEIKDPFDIYARVGESEDIETKDGFNVYGKEEESKDTEHYKLK